MPTKPITLEAGATGTLTFSFTPGELGLYTVSGDDVVAEFLVMPVPVVDIRVIDIQVSDITLGETIEIVVTCENFGNIAGTETIEITVV